MSRYAENTHVSSEQSRAEIKRTLSRYGATGFMYGWQRAQDVVGFDMSGRRIRFVLPLPDKEARDFTHTESRGIRRSPQEQIARWEQGCRSRWRALALAVKAKLEAVASGITSFEEEFMGHIVLPGGQTVGSWMQPQIARSYDSGKMPPLLEGPK